MNYGNIKLVSIEYKGTDHNGPVTLGMEVDSQGSQSFAADPVYNKIKYLNLTVWDSTYSSPDTSVDVNITIGSGGGQDGITIPVRVATDGKTIHYRKAIRVPALLNPLDIAVFYVHIESKGRPSGITEYSRLKNETGMFLVNKPSYGAPRQTATNNLVNNLFPDFYSDAVALANEWGVPNIPFNSANTYNENSNNLQLIILGLDNAWNSSSGSTEISAFNSSFEDFNAGFEQLRTDLISNNEYKGHTISEVELPGIFEENFELDADCLCKFFQLYSSFTPETKAKLDDLQNRLNTYFAELLFYSQSIGEGELELVPAITPCDQFKEIKRFFELYKDSEYSNWG
jgi:hypothetical protein